MSLPACCLGCCFLPVLAVAPPPSGAVFARRVSVSSALEGSKVASPQYVVVGPSPRHEMLCHYITVVTPLSTTSVHHSRWSQAARDCLRANPAHGSQKGAEYPRITPHALASTP